MITTEDILNMNFYKKEKFTGSYKGIPLLKVGAHDAGARGQHTHQFGVEQIACGGVIRAHAAGNGIVHEGLEDAFQIGPNMKNI